MGPIQSAGQNLDCRPLWVGGMGVQGSCNANCSEEPQSLLLTAQNVGRAFWEGDMAKVPVRCVCLAHPPVQPMSVDPLDSPGCRLTLLSTLEETLERKQWPYYLPIPKGKSFPWHSYCQGFK